MFSCSYYYCQWDLYQLTRQDLDDAAVLEHWGVMVETVMTDKMIDIQQTEVDEDQAANNGRGSRCHMASSDVSLEGL